MSRNLRVAIAVGVMVFAAVGWWLRGHRGEAPPAAQVAAPAAAPAGRAERPQRGTMPRAPSSAAHFGVSLARGYSTISIRRFFPLLLLTGRY